ncbi:hypothetical protein Vi05172_g9363 [Venturia inaequalis]|nr:hypothetical protein Vi05172_g9363 [Venturia inaequalis]
MFRKLFFLLLGLATSIMGQIPCASSIDCTVDKTGLSGLYCIGCDAHAGKDGHCVVAEECTKTPTCRCW